MDTKKSEIVMENSNNCFNKEQHFDTNKQTKTLLGNKDFKIDFFYFHILDFLITKLISC